MGKKGKKEVVVERPVMKRVLGVLSQLSEREVSEGDMELELVGDLHISTIDLSGHLTREFPGFGVEWNWIFLLDTVGELVEYMEDEEKIIQRLSREKKAHQGCSETFMSGAMGALG